MLKEGRLVRGQKKESNFKPETRPILLTAIFSLHYCTLLYSSNSLSGRRCFIPVVVVTADNRLSFPYSFCYWINFQLFFTLFSWEFQWFLPFFAQIWCFFRVIIAANWTSLMNRWKITRMKWNIFIYLFWLGSCTFLFVLLYKHTCFLVLISGFIK